MFLVISSGFMGFYALLGAVAKLDPKQVTEISGASAGSIVGFLMLLCHWNHQKILSLVLQDVKKKLKPNLKNFASNYGFIPEKKLLSIFESACDFFGIKRDISFKELYEINPIKFHVSVTCIELSRTEYMSVSTTPDMSVCKALCMSCAVPLLMTPVKHNGFHYVDGAVTEAVPVSIFVDKPRGDILVVCLRKPSISKINSLKSYMLSLVGVISNMRSSLEGVRHIEIDTQDIDINDPTMTLETKLRLFLMGYST